MTNEQLARLEEEKEALIFSLENNGVKYLVTQMNNNNIYSDLLIEKRRSEISSTDEISWYAFRQSDKLNSQNDKIELLEMLSNKKYRELKNHIYRCLSCICSNTNDRELFNFLIDKMIVESDDLKVTILSQLRNVKKDLTYNIEPIKKLVAEGTYEVSHAAIKSLSFSDDVEVETLLLDEFLVADKHMKGMICAPLATVGTERSIPILKEEYKRTRDGFLRWAIKNAIQEIEKKTVGKRDIT